MFSFRSIDTYHSQLKQSFINCVTTVEHYLAQIENNKHLNAFIEVYADEALEKAALLDKKTKKW